MAENEKVSSIIINKQAGILYERFVKLLTEKGQAYIDRTEEDLLQGSVSMTARELANFEAHKQSPIGYGILRYLNERFTPEKTAITNTREMGDYIQEHGWVKSFITPDYFGVTTIIDSHIGEFKTMAEEFPHAAEAYGKLITQLEDQKEVIAVSAIAEGYAEGAIPVEVSSLEDEELWKYAVGGGFASVEVSWSQKQGVAIQEAARIENETVFEQLEQN